MKCPYCSSEDTKVIDKRLTPNGLNRRRRECNSCQKRFTTYEKLEIEDLTVVKKDGRRQSFDRDKIELSIRKACEKRPIPLRKIQDLTNEITESIRNMNVQEITTQEIGEMVIKKLQELDEVAYVRYASYYKHFKDVKEFEKELKKLEEQEIKGTIKKVKKRDGMIVDFDQNKITEAIWNAAKDVGGTDEELARKLSDQVVVELEKKFSHKIPNVEEIQDVVEKVLVENGHYKTAKAYILYRKQHERLREEKSTFVAVEKSMDEYLDKTDWRVRENSNEAFSFSGLMLHVAGKVIANYALTNMYTPAINEAHRKGYIHIHDLGHAVIGYCAGWSLKNLIILGFGGVPSKVDAKPAKHLGSLVHQMVNFLGCLQMEFAGAQSFSSADTLLAPFVKVDNLDYKEVKQCMQELVYSLNIPSRWGAQYPFTNITFDWIVPEDMKNEKAIVGGKEQDFTYSDCQKEMDMINRAFLEVMKEGDANGRIFTFPIPTYNLTKDFDWDSENTKLLFEVAAKYGTPYFQNYIGSDLDPKSIRAMCCRLNLDLNELRKKGNGLFGAGEQTGSIGVVTINMNRIAYESKNKKEFFDRLRYYMELAKQSLEIKRKVIQKNMDNGLMPFAKRYLGNFNNYFSTIGLCGMNEACLNLLGKNIATPEGKQLVIDTLLFMRDVLKEFQHDTGNLYNLEATPAESASYRFGRLDKELHPKIITAGVKAPYLTNSTQLPVNYTDNVIEALEHQNDIQPLYTGGTVFHTFMGERMSSGEACKILVKKIAENTRIPYFSITPTFSICKSHGYMKGEVYTCPKCNTETEVFSRVVGYFRPVANWNIGKQEEFKDRLEFSEEKSMREFNFLTTKAEPQAPMQTIV